MTRQDSLAILLSGVLSALLGTEPVRSWVRGFPQLLARAVLSLVRGLLGLPKREQKPLPRR
jgi:hypothetical protein